MSNMTPTQAGQVRDVPEESSFVNVEAWTEEAMRAIGSPPDRLAPSHTWNLGFSVNPSRWRPSRPPGARCASR